MIQLDNIAITLRPRGHWQSMDLGFQMARQWLWPLTSLWLCTALPVFLLLHLTPGVNEWVGLLIWWWCKPLYEAPLHFWCSRALFGERVSRRASLRATVRNLPGLLVTYLGPRRLSLARSVYVNVLMLENQRGTTRNQRIRLIGNTSSRAAILTSICLNAEAILTYGCVLIAAAMLPPELVEVDWWLLLADDSDNWLSEVINWMSLIGAGIVAPFFVCAGFSLYINRRTVLEAWDLQLDFHRVTQNGTARVRPLVATILLLALFTGNGGAPPAQASVDPAQVKIQIDAILADEAFGKTQQYSQLQFVDQQDNHTHSNPGWLAVLLQKLSGYTQFMLWVLFITAMLALAWLAWHFSPTLRKSRSSRPARLGESLLKSPLQSVAPLPDNPAQSARQLIENGHHRQALSLLYRATLAHPLLVDVQGFDRGTTELECLRRARQVLPAELANTFSELTRLWQRQAYAGRSSNPEDLLEICNTWQNQFGAK